MVDKSPDALHAPEDDATATRTLLWPLLALLYQGIEQAIEKVRTHFSDHVLMYSPYAFSNLVRCHLHDFLGPAKAGALGFKVWRLPLDGIELDYKGCWIKAWKGDDELPPPRSGTNEEYCYQPSLFPLGAPGAPPRRLVVTWELNGDMSLKALFLICPKWDGAEDVHWIVDIPHPATTMSGGEHFASSDDLDDETQSQTGTKGQ